MKYLKIALFACLFAPVCAQAQATKTVPLGGNWVLNTKIPYTFDTASFNKQFSDQMNTVRAMQAARQTQPAGLNVPAAQPAEPADETLYTRDIVSRETILKSDGYQITPSREWYVKKHAPSACSFYKGWEKGEDLSFVQKGQERRACEAEMSPKYQRHTCAFCGQPINGACGATSTWSDDDGTHYAHADCFAEHRHQAAKEKLMKGLDISDELCASFDRQEQQRIAAQKQLAAQLKKQEQLRASQAPEPTLIVHPVTRPLEEVNKDIQRFVARHSQSLQEAGKAKRAHKTLTKKQVKLLDKFNALHAEFQRASAK